MRQISSDRHHNSEVRVTRTIDYEAVVSVHSIIRPHLLILGCVAMFAIFPNTGHTQLNPPEHPPASLPPNTRWSMPTPGYGDAIVVAPTTASAAPLIVVLHGSWDRPEWICDVFSQLTRGSAWLLCLRGKLRTESPPDGARWTLGRLADTRQELNIAVDMLRRIAPKRIQPGIALLAGFSKGAGHAQALAAKKPKRFPRVLLVEGGHRLKNRRERIAAKQRIAFGCGTKACHKRASGLCERYRQHNGECQVETDLEYGHSYNPPFHRSGRRLLRWLEL